jgi:hypothetical protein
MTPEELQNKVSQHETDLSDQLTQIVALQRKVDTLVALMENFFAFTSSGIQRFSDQQENAFRKIPELLKELREPAEPQT